MMIDHSWPSYSDCQRKELGMIQSLFHKKDIPEYKNNTRMRTIMMVISCVINPLRQCFTNCLSQSASCSLITASHANHSFVRHSIVSILENLTDNRFLKKQNSSVSFSNVRTPWKVLWAIFFLTGRYYPLKFRFIIKIVVLVKGLFAWTVWMKEPWAKEVLWCSSFKQLI